MPKNQADRCNRIMSMMLMLVPKLRTFPTCSFGRLLHLFYKIVYSMIGTICITDIFIAISYDHVCLLKELCTSTFLVLIICLHLFARLRNLLVMASISG